jgi:[protein-PII] uridylyltransferase
MCAANGAGPARIASFEAADAVLGERSDRVDALVIESFRTHLEAVFGNGVAVAAVGGFGRRELFPFSDVDVLVLTREGLRNSEVKEPVGRFLQALWDAGLRLSHSVHTVEQCCQVYEHNVELSISLLDYRPLAGDQTLRDEMAAALPRFYRMYGRSLARRLAKLTRFRHAKYQNTIFHLEPNIKDTPGALRDLQVVRWMVKLNGGEERVDLGAAWRFLAPIRMYLHERSRRDDNLLTFEIQDAITGNPAEMMRSYYRHARSVCARALEIVEAAEESQPTLVQQFRDWRSRLSNSDFTIARDRLFVRSPGQLGSDPGLVFRYLQFTARHGIPAAPEVQRRVSAAAAEIAAAAALKPIWPELKEILSLPKAAAAVREMQATGLLTALIPEWARIDCLVVRDFYHRYTVDEHTVVALEALEDIADTRFRDLLAEVDHVELLRMAILLHDTGKGSGREHTAESRRIAGVIGDRIGMAAEERDTVQNLIARHLEMPAVTASRDLDDAQTGRLLAQKVGTVEALRMLTLLTYADISAVNPTAMTPWRADQLWRAYLLGYEELTRELNSERVHDFDSTDSGTREFVEGLPNRYLRTHTMEQIRAHAALAGGVPYKGAAVELVRNEGYWRLVVLARDRPFLLASIAGTLASFGMNILKAEAFANARGLIVDTFSFADPVRTLELNPSEVDRLRDTILRVVTGRQDVKRLLAGRRSTSARARRIEPRVVFNNEASQSATLIEIVAEDRPGLLYDLTSTMSGAGCDIVVVLIDTEAHKALDVFYVTANGGKVTAELEAKLKAELSAVCAGPR